MGDYPGFADWTVTVITSLPRETERDLTTEEGGKVMREARCQASGLEDGGRVGSQ